MLKEIVMQKPYLENQTVDTIYFGGGTPSLLTASEISTLIAAIYENYKVGDLKECTIEANPDDLSPKYLKELKATGIDRLSIGVQSFRQEDLLFMHRAHTAQQADFAIKASQDTGFTNLSIDLIYGTPGLTDAAWKQNLLIMKGLSIPHFSAYALTVEQKTALHHAIAQKKAAPVDPAQSAGQFEILMESAASLGYDHYEISNFALPNHYAVHNTNYWLGAHYLGIGPAAHSFNGKGRKWNIANNALYATSILENNKLNCEEEALSPTEQINEYIMTSLRTMWGLNMDKITKSWGAINLKAIIDQAKVYLDNKMLVIDGNFLKLTNKGKLFADKIASDLFIDAILDH